MGKRLLKERIQTCPALRVHKKGISQFFLYPCSCYNTLMITHKNRANEEEDDEQFSETNEDWGSEKGGGAGAKKN